ncbi:hypothetical protein SHIRM173S_12889 [Streptomyces hirsutus]
MIAVQLLIGLATLVVNAFFVGAESAVHYRRAARSHKRRADRSHQPSRVKQHLVAAEQPSPRATGAATVL